MPDDLIDSLSVPQRLALAYAPKIAKPGFLALFALDARLAGALRQASEPVMAQMRLAWWRDQLRLEPAARERSDKLILALDFFAGEEEAVLALVDGWETLLSDSLDAAGFAAARGAGFAALARTLGHDDAAVPAAQAGRRFAFADLAANLADPEEKQAVLALAKGEGGAAARLPRALRSLAVLDGLARRSLARGGAPLIDGLGAMCAAIRLGLAGR